MEIANLATATIRLTTSKDAQQIWRLFQDAMYAHTHADWRLPGDWLGTPGFVVIEGPAARATSMFGRRTQEITACLAVGADPLPASWVRVTAMRRTPHAQEILAAMIDAVLPFLRESGVTELGWLAVESWPDEMLPMIGFRRVNWITTFIKEGVEIPFETSLYEAEGVTIRPVMVDDMEKLAEIEAAAFEPLWRHSAAGLKLAQRHAICFDVALMDGQIVGFQYSASNQQGAGAHLVRITVHPAAQGLGVGSVLIQAAFEQYRRRGLKRVSLNTQLDNIASHRLYEKFGFYRTGDQMPVWVLDLES
jgi:ribosomal protein S18 acetylase RimI-like enzyme